MLTAAARGAHAHPVALCSSELVDEEREGNADDDEGEERELAGWSVCRVGLRSSRHTQSKHKQSQRPSTECTSEGVAVGCNGLEYKLGCNQLCNPDPLSPLLPLTLTSHSSRLKLRLALAGMAPLTAIHRSAVPPSGASIAVSCTLAPPSPSHNARRARGHLVTARNNVVRVYEVVEHASAAEQVGRALLRYSREMSTRGTEHGRDIFAGQDMR